MNEVAVTTNAMQGFAVAAANMDEAMRVCEWLAKSPLIPTAYQGKPAAIWTAGAMGARLGVDLFTALSGIASINGRPAIWGDLLRGLILAHAELEDIQEDLEGEGESLVAVCTIKRRKMSAYTARFGVQDAKKAGLLGKGPWKDYTADMLVNRAFGRAARRRFADVLSGLHVAEELQDAEVVDIRPVEIKDAVVRPANVRPAATMETSSNITVTSVAESGPVGVVVNAPEPEPETTAEPDWQTEASHWGTKLIRAKKVDETKAKLADMGVNKINELDPTGAKAFCAWAEEILE